MKKLTVLLLTLIISLAFALPVFAEVVELDPFTGEIRGVVSDDTTRVHLSPYCDYNRETGFYEYVSPSDPGAQIDSTAFDGMIALPGVCVLVGDTAEATLYLEGVEVDEGEFESLTDTGSYVMLDKNEQRIFGFTIVGFRTGAISEFTLPDGYSMHGVTRDGTNIKYESKRVPMEIEGEYVVNYTNDAADVTYTFDVYVDHTAPVIELGGLDENMNARNPVDLLSQDDAVELIVTLDGKTITPSKQFTRPGTYVITAWDDADNASETSFVIKTYFNLSLVAALIILIVVLGSMAVYLIVNRKNLKVR